MIECCDNCKLCFKIEKLDYSHGGCEHSWPEGFICMACAKEGVAKLIPSVKPSVR